jgi:hypothetical protein
VGDGPAAGAAAGGVSGGQGDEPPAAGARLGHQPRNLRHPQCRPLVTDRLLPPSLPPCVVLCGSRLQGFAAPRLFRWLIATGGWGKQACGIFLVPPCWSDGALWGFRFEGVDLTD